jgi:hypothetical protein
MVPERHLSASIMPTEGATKTDRALMHTTGSETRTSPFRSFVSQTKSAAVCTSTCHIVDGFARRMSSQLVAALSVPCCVRVIHPDRSVHFVSWPLVGPVHTRRHTAINYERLTGHK